MGIHFEHINSDSAPYPLARHVLHDDESYAYDAAELVTSVPLKTAMHQRLCDPWDQGQIGSCTANAALGCLMTEPFHRGWAFTEQDAVELYKQETRLDNRQIPGVYPPDDTGSTGLWSMKALKRAGYISSYRWAFSLNTTLKLLTLGPVSVGTVWLNSMFNTDPDGFIHVDYTSGVAGGHQYQLIGHDLEREAVRVCNSWGTSWGEGGYAWLAVDDLRWLLKQRGDVVVPVI